MKKKRIQLWLVLLFSVAFEAIGAQNSVPVPKLSSPGVYQGYTKRIYQGVLTRSVYLTMRDGVKLAVDYSLPRGLGKSEKIPAILVQTRYWRNMSIKIMKDPAREYLVSYGYAVVAVDVRGTGASFGTWPYPWSEDEIKDGAEVVDWLISQPWSNGKVGAYGNSYVGATAEFLLVNKHPAVKAVVIRYSLFDSYTDIAFPGGIYHNWFMDTWNQVDRALDANDVATLSKMIGLKIPFVEILPGVKPVGNPIEGNKALKQALKDHQNNGDVYEESRKAEYRDFYWDKWRNSIERISPYYYREQIEASGAAIYSYTGWYDGYYTSAGINRYLTVSNPKKLIIGPWAHGGKENISPWRDSRKVKFNHNAELLRFFDYHLKGIDNGIMTEPPVYYYTMAEEKWKSSNLWPPPSNITTYYFSEAKTLSTTPPNLDDAFDYYKVDYTAGTGHSARSNSLVNLKNVPIEYPDRASADKKLLVYETSALSEDLEITGHPVVRLYVSSSADDGQFFVYLEDVSPEGKVSYITEGMLRAKCRAISTEKPPYQMAPGVPYHTFLEKDAKPMTPGQITLITFDLQPTSVLFRKGHKIRVAIAGADKDHFALPQGPEPELKFYRSTNYPSAIDLPLIPR